MPDQQDTEYSEPCDLCGHGRIYQPFQKFCADCERRYPPSLIKASCEPLTNPSVYAVGLPAAMVVVFERAEIHGDYVTLEGAVGLYRNDKSEKIGIINGLDVRVDQIVWCREHDATEDE